MMDQPQLFKFPKIRDTQGSLSFAEGKDLPFEIKRVFWLTHINDLVVRGQHAHRTSKQLLLALEGVIEVTLEDLDGECLNFELNSPDMALYIPPMFWGKISFHKKAIGLALADDLYNEQDYIRNYNEFKKMNHD